MNLLIDIFPQDNIGNRVVVFDAKCDFIFFRMYRYKFAELSKCNMQDVGPHLTLRLRKIIENGETQVIDYRRIEYKDENVFL
ncbi:Ribosome production factor 1 [Gurleya vavrai]